MVGRYGPHSPAETYVEHRYPEQLFDTGELRLNYATAGEASMPAVQLTVQLIVMSSVPVAVTFTDTAAGAGAVPVSVQA